jgi:hypothetical protein
VPRGHDVRPVYFEDASQELGPASFGVAYGFRFALDPDDVLLVILVSLGRFTTFGTLARRLPAVVAL